MVTEGPNPRPAPRPDYPLGLGCLWWWFIALICLIILFGGGWWWGGWYGPPPWYGRPGAQTVPPGRQAATVPTGAFPGEFVGRDVTVSGKVDAVIGQGAFTLAPAAADGHRLLVVAPQSAAPTPAVKKGDTVQVKGDVQLFDRAAFDKESKETLPQDATVPFTGHPAVLASSVSVASHS